MLTILEVVSIYYNRTRTMFVRMEIYYIVMLAYLYFIFIYRYYQHAFTYSDICIVASIHI